MKSHLYKNKTEAEDAANKLGCKGTHKDKKGMWLPCSSHEKLLELTKKGEKGELEELVDFDGTLKTSKIPILDPNMTPRKTTDQTVAATRVTQDPLMRGYRTYYGESFIREEDMADAFGFEETKYMDAKDTIDYLHDKLGLDADEAESRAEEMGKDPDLDEKSEYKDDEDFVMHGRIVEKQKVNEGLLKGKHEKFISQLFKKIKDNFSSRNLKRTTNIDVVYTYRYSDNINLQIKIIQDFMVPYNTYKLSLDGTPVKVSYPLAAQIAIFFTQKYRKSKKLDKKILDLGNEKVLDHRAKEISADLNLERYEKHKTLNKEQVIKMAEDALLKKSTERGIVPKDDNSKASPILRRNIRALKNLADIEGVDKAELIKMLKEGNISEMHPSWEAETPEEYKETYNDFLDKVRDFLQTKTEMDEVQVNEYIDYWHGRGYLGDLWSSGATPKEAIDDLKNEKGKIFWRN